MNLNRIKILSLCILGFVVISHNSSAQCIPYNAYSAAVVTLGGKGGEILPSVAFNNFSRGQFKVGLAFRLNPFLADKKRYITALPFSHQAKQDQAFSSPIKF